MNIQQLRVIVELSKRKSLIEIGEALEITQPTVSFHMRKLEEELGISLFMKEKRNLVLTKACHELVPYAKKILELMDEAKQKMHLVQNKENSRLRISAGHTPATYYLPSYIQLFQQLHPDIELNLSVNQAKKSIQMLRERQIDLAIVSLESFSIAGLNIHPLKEDKLLLVYAPINRLASLSEITIKDLDNEVFLLHEEGATSRIVANDWAKQTGLLMPQRMELASIETIKEGVKRNMGIGILPEKSIVSEIESGQLLSIPLPEYEHRRCICLVYHNEEQLPPEVKLFIWFTIENMK
ncbi:HTH-type transcriptional regulator GltC [Paenibacillus plantiphilus]|uniref:HTH-type transcriptional regulator GltC n=1 Tax=Paenibacillus plantiphilus TaxID=2905650 RepID=A0ABM9C9K0_9BACL|nr:LysR family transcriptional regulator [Paenibacillus plantiphilus]CAH1205452.1 HTH-type transcriptional regulator GltC [Paenibacillus plantiphilus]